jgi:hypothetical protein
LNIFPFSKYRLGEATAKYIEIEKQIAAGENKLAVLVSAGSKSDLQRAYPNYFGDTVAFVEQLNAMD